jgi:hypothetical protein
MPTTINRKNCSQRSDSSPRRTGKAQSEVSKGSRFMLILRAIEFATTT